MPMALALSPVASYADGSYKQNQVQADGSEAVVAEGAQTGESASSEADSNTAGGLIEGNTPSAEDPSGEASDPGDNDVPFPGGAEGGAADGAGKGGEPAGPSGQPDTDVDPGAPEPPRETPLADGSYVVLPACSDDQDHGAVLPPEGRVARRRRGEGGTGLGAESGASTLAEPAHMRWRDWRKCVGENGENYIDANNSRLTLPWIVLHPRSLSSALSCLMIL